MNESVGSAHLGFMARVKEEMEVCGPVSPLCCVVAERSCAGGTVPRAILSVCRINNASSGRVHQQKKTLPTAQYHLYTEAS